MSRSLTDTVSATLDEMVPAIQQVMGRALLPVFDNARAKWPVRKKNSKDSRGRLAIKFVGRGERFTAQISNNAWYAGLINKGRTAEELIFEPGMEAADKAAREVAEEFARRANAVT